MQYHAVTFSEIEHYKSISFTYLPDKLAHVEIVDASNIIGLSEEPIIVTIKLTKRDLKKIAAQIDDLLTKFD